MARHRFLQNLDLNEEKYDFEDYGQSIEEDSILSPSQAQFMYPRGRLNSSENPKLNEYISPDRTLEEEEFIEEEEDDGDKNMAQASSSAPLFVIDDLAGAHLDDDDTTAPNTDKWAYDKCSSGQSMNGAYKPTQRQNFSKRVPPSTVASSTTAASAASIVSPAIDRLRLSEPVKKSRETSKSPNRPSSAAPVQTAILTPNSSSSRLQALLEKSATGTPRVSSRKRPSDSKPVVNLVVIGHVDAGKSTLMGHLLFLLGKVDQKQMHKYRQESTKLGKASFAYAWVLDESSEERSRGVTMDIARTAFQTPNRQIVLLDAPGHKDFIPNMITGAAQADAALLVVNATRGEFETGFEQGGQTMEHAMLVRALGVSQLAVAVNKMDTIEWDQQRFEEMKEKLTVFLQKQAGFQQVVFVPVSGLVGDNLTTTCPSDHPLARWYTRPTLLAVIDGFAARSRRDDGPLRLVVSDVFRGVVGGGISVSGKLESGVIENGDKVIVMPNGDLATVKNVVSDCNTDGEGNSGACFAGDQCTLTLTGFQGSMEQASISPGHVICHPEYQPILPIQKFTARLVLFASCAIPMTKGFPAVLHAHAVCEPVTVTRLLSQVNKTTGQLLKNNPRCLTKNTSGVVEMQTERPICIETYAECKELGRITLRSNGKTIAAGLIERLLG